MGAHYHLLFVLWQGLLSPSFRRNVLSKKKGAGGFCGAKDQTYHLKLFFGGRGGVGNAVPERE